MRTDPSKPLNVSLVWDGGESERVGRLAYRDRKAYFEFDMAFLNTAKPISPFSLPVEPGLKQSSKPDLFEGLHGVFHDSLPDGWGRLLQDRKAREMGIDPNTLTPLDRLACVGHSGIGALAYEPATSSWTIQGSKVEIADLASQAEALLKGETADILSDLFQAGGSPGGARPKVLLDILTDGTATHASLGRADTTKPMLVKFRGAGDPEDVGRMEIAYADMAKLAGIQMPETMLLRDNDGRHHFAVRRFDCDGPYRIHVQSACALLDTDYRLPSLDYEALLQVTRGLTRDHRAIIEMFRRAVFNVLACNQDDHSKQFSFLMDRQAEWCLAPAYDLTFAPGPNGHHMTSVLGKGDRIDAETLHKLAERSSISPREASSIINEVEEAVMAWPKFAKKYDVGRKTMQRVEEGLQRARL